MTSVDEVASRAAVSVSTVSRAFSKPESVRPDTRERVLAIARDLGYSPNRVARSLARGRTGTIGLFVPDVANPFFAPLIKGVQSQARRQEYSVLLAESDEQPEDEFDIVMDMAAQVDGLVLGAPRMPDEQLRRVLDTVPAILVNRDLPAAPGRVLSGTEGFTQAVEHLAALGHQRIGYVAGPTVTYSNSIRRAALADAAAKYDIDLVELGPVVPRFESGVRAADSILLSKVTAVVTYNDLVALGLMSQLHHRGVRIPADISVIGIDDIWIANTTIPPLTTVRVPADEFGGHAVRALVEVLSRGGGHSEPVHVATELIVRGSTGPVRQQGTPA